MTDYQDRHCHLPNTSPCLCALEETISLPAVIRAVCSLERGVSLTLDEGCLPRHTLGMLSQLEESLSVGRAIESQTLILPIEVTLISVEESVSKVSVDNITQWYI